MTTFTGSYNDNASKFATLENGGVMPWWGSFTSAYDFALATDLALGNPDTPLGQYGLFAWTRSITHGVRGTAMYSNSTATVITTYNPSITPATSRPWAQATLVPAAGSGGSADVPGPLPVLGLAVAFGFSRQLRKRIKASASSPPSTSEA